MKFTYAVTSVVGTVRRQNQDDFYLNGITRGHENPDRSASDNCEEEYASFAVCDGMGGEKYGDIASQIAVETFLKYPEEALWQDWDDYINQANNEICSFSEEHGVRSGTTLAGLFVKGNQFCAVNVGDSRIYQVKNGKLEQLSRDHTEFQNLVDCGKLTKADFAFTNTHNHLTQHLGIEPEEMVIEPYVVYRKLEAEEEVFLLCSDGLYGSVDEEQLYEEMTSGKPVGEICEELVRLAAVQGSRDNITAMMVCVESTPVLEEASTSVMLDQMLSAMNQKGDAEGTLTGSQTTAFDGNEGEPTLVKDLNVTVTGNDEEPTLIEGQMPAFTENSVKNPQADAKIPEPQVVRLSGGPHPIESEKEKAGGIGNLPAIWLIPAAILVVIGYYILGRM